MLDVYKRQVILFEKTERLTFTGTDYDLSLLSGFYGTAFMAVSYTHLLLCTSIEVRGEESTTGCPSVRSKSIK